MDEKILSAIGDQLEEMNKHLAALVRAKTWSEDGPSEQWAYGEVETEQPLDKTDLKAELAVPTTYPLVDRALLVAEKVAEIKLAKRIDNFKTDSQALTGSVLVPRQSDIEKGEAAGNLICEIDGDFALAQYSWTKRGVFRLLQRGNPGNWWDIGEVRTLADLGRHLQGAIAASKVPGYAAGDDFIPF